MDVMPQPDRIAERHERIWIIAASPVIWALHFMVCYVTAAMWCGRFGPPDDPFATVRVAIAAYTVVALAAIGAIGWAGRRAQRRAQDAPPYDADSPEDRHGFIGYATVLLSGLSAVATIYSAMTVLFIETCR